MEVEEIRIQGTVEDVIFQNQDNGYAVFSLETEEDEIICVGVVPQLHSGESLSVSGSWTVHPTYGRQLSVQFFEKTIPTTAAGIEKYLASGVIRGIGPKTAKKIVEKFGEAAFHVIEEKPDRLVEIQGITYAKAQKISTVFREQHELRRVMLFLQDFGVTPVYAMKIYKKYKAKTFEVVQNNPYRLAEDIFGIGFKMADRMAVHAGILPDSEHRIRSGIKYILNQATGNGHVYLPQEILVRRTAELLELLEPVIENVVRTLQIEHQLWREKIDDVDCVYLNSFYYAEMAVAKKLLELAEDFSEENGDQLDTILQTVEEKNKISLASQQRLAVQEAMTNGVLIITGGPGTGKTTTIHTILQIFEEEGLEVLLAAPTGRAAKRMTEATGKKAQTIHRLLGISFLHEDSRRQQFDKNEENPLEADVIVIDESSMMDILLMHALMKAVAVGTRVIFVGDVDQLPSVGPGNVLKDMIRSERLKVVRLQDIFRQAQESAIIMNAHRINAGEEPILNDKAKDFFFVRRTQTDSVAASVVELATTRLPSFLECNALRDIQILTPMRKGPLGVVSLNERLQAALNPSHPKRKEKEYRNLIFREGDKIMQIKNNYNLAWEIRDERGRVSENGVGIFNGDEGRIVRIGLEEENMDILFDDNKKVTYEFSQLDELELAYAITIHKSQGSEYPVVILPVFSGPPMLMTRNLLYTAVTRAKRLVVLVGLSDMIQVMIANNQEMQRYSTLSHRICHLYDFMQGAGL